MSFNTTTQNTNKKIWCRYRCWGHQTSPLPACEAQEAGRVHKFWSFGFDTPHSPENMNTEYNWQKLPNSSVISIILRCTWIICKFKTIWLRDKTVRALPYRQIILTLNLISIGTKHAFPESTSCGMMMRGLAARTYKWRNACKWYLQPQ